MRNLTVLRILFALFMLYFAWPRVSYSTSLEMVFWGMWLGFFLLVFGSNLANLLQMIEPPIMEQSLEENKIRARR